jgi:urease accessory protein
LLSALIHPFLGIDHLAVVLVVAWWSARQNRLGRIGVPLLFAAITALGVVLPEWALPGGGSLLALALVGLGALAWNDRNPANLLALGLAALLAFIQGQAHGIGAGPPLNMAVMHGAGIGAASGIAIAVFAVAIRRAANWRRTVKVWPGSASA